ncbi:MAG: hypothetical protein KGH61_00420 [Candidatus Micrarchaeota archaeon]|nr:hypothetical protein [Candidatus Micrarchaeota archaeon]MDE1847401.1 hypothetical protein [Candidatus Micrarchaeota archaeon]MDE1864016.1 hypothetical protein [Candidatus Micrarchaeota archaeon]
MAHKMLQLFKKKEETKHITTPNGIDYTVKNSSILEFGGLVRENRYWKSCPVHPTEPIDVRSGGIHIEVFDVFCENVKGHAVVSIYTQRGELQSDLVGFSHAKEIAIKTMDTEILTLLDGISQDLVESYYARLKR